MQAIYILYSFERTVLNVTFFNKLLKQFDEDQQSKISHFMLKQLIYN